MLPRSNSLAAVGCGIILLLHTIGATSDDSATSIDGANDRIVQQRDAFRAIYADVELGNWQLALDNTALLEDYVLWPDLQAAYFRNQIRSVDDALIRSYLDQYGTLKPARELRYRYALQLAADARFDEYFDVYQQYYQGLDLAKLDCLALQAEIKAGRAARIVSRATDLWLTGRSQADECDPVFEYLRDNGHLTKTLYRARYDLAIDARQYSLARYLARSLETGLVDQANHWINAQSKPEKFLDGVEPGNDNLVSRSQILYAIRRIALNRPLLANEYWQRVEGKFAFDDQQRHETDRYIALWAAREHLAEARDLLDALPTAAVDTETLRWRVRVSLREKDWQAVIDSTEQLPADEFAKSEWQFWLAVAMRETGGSETADAILETLAQERGYYSFLAADELGRPYAFEHAPLTSNSALVTNLAQQPELIRARELFLVGLEGRGRSEWDAVIRSMNREQHLGAAKLAHDWGWHSRAIATIAKAGEYDDLDIRYPLPWQTEFIASSETADIPHSWAYGIARSESLFMRDIRSSAGAIGVMQLMPATGRETAGEINLKYGGTVTLTDVASNIRLGTAYLGKMYDRFANNQVLATAAYNAGPHRVEKWLPSDGELDGRIWIENIPYRETRQYVRRVLADAAVFHWRLTGQNQRVTDHVSVVSAGSDTQQIAASSAQ